MEEILAYALVALIAVTVIATAVWFHKCALRKKREEEARLIERKKNIDAYWDNMNKIRGERVAKVNSTPIKKTEVPPRGKETTVKYTAPAPAPSVSTTSSSSSDDGFLTGMLVGAVIDNLMHSSSSPSPVEERSVGVSKSESSWGFDDSDSRKSISDSMSSSWGSSDSSSSSDSWSSSDSGPSSDW